MARKIDWSGVKEYLFNHGEKITLGSCAFLALALGLWGIWSATSAGRAEGTNKTFGEVMSGIALQIKQGITSAPLPDPNKVAALPDWKPLTSDHKPVPFINQGEDSADKRKRPLVLPIRNEPNNIRWEYINGLVLTHEYGINGNKQYVKGLEPAGMAEAGQPMPLPKIKAPGAVQPAGGGAVPIPPFLQAGRPVRMVVVHAVFPMKQQVEEFRKALNMLSQEEMFVKNRDDLPRPVGFDVYRFEVMPDGKPSAKPVFLLGVDPEDGVFKINASLEKLMRESIYDERSAELLEKWIYAGLTTPMPKLANRKYPRFTIPGFDIEWAWLDEDKNGEMVAGNLPGPGPGAKKEGPIVNPLPGFKGFKGRPQMPMPEGGGPGVKPVAAEFKPKDIMVKEPHMLIDSHPTLVSRLFPGKEKRIDQDMNVYHVFGQFPTPANAAVPPGGQAMPNLANLERYFAAWDIENPNAAGPGGAAGQAAPPVGLRKFGGGGEGKVPVGPGGVGVVPPATLFPNWNRDALVRFVDPSVEPGKTYFYTIRVRLANPNHGLDLNGKPKEVAFQALAANKELPPSDWVQTPHIPIPQEYHLFAMDQHLFDDLADGKVEKKNQPWPPSVVNNYTPFQIHQWIPKKRDSVVPLDYVIGDWVIAEGQMVRKGDYIGMGLTVQAPVWVKDKDAFEVPQTKDPNNKNKFAPKGIHLNMEKDGKAPVLVDFTGGKRLTKSNTLEEETAVDALILLPDGKLKVLNSREAADLAERQERVVNARRRVTEVQSNTAAPGPRVGGPGPGGETPLPGLRPKGGG